MSVQIYLEVLIDIPLNTYYLQHKSEVHSKLNVFQRLVIETMLSQSL